MDAAWAGQWDMHEIIISLGLSIFSRDDERIIGQGIIAKCQLEGLNPVSESDRKTAEQGWYQKTQIGHIVLF